MNDNIDERIDKLLNKIDKMNEEIKNLIDKQKENNINCVLSRYSFCDSITSTQYAEAA